MKTITAPDTHTVVITLSQPHAPLLADLAMYAYSVVPEKLVKAAGQGRSSSTRWAAGRSWSRSYSADSEVDLARNPYFYGTKPKISKVKIMIVPNDNTRVLMLESKKADVIENPPGNLVSQINKTPGPQRAAVPVDPGRFHPAGPALQAVQEPATCGRR